jgi:hypothetical protein
MYNKRMEKQESRPMLRVYRCHETHPESMNRLPGARALALLALLLVFFASACSGTAAAPEAAAPEAAPPGTIPLTIGEHRLYVELAATRQERRQGLMFREEMPPNGGMLFVFPSEQPRSFWMKDTPLPLSIAFLDAERRIINIADMQPFDTSSHPSAGPAKYALEVHQGWFAERGIEAGALCEFELPADLLVQ